MENGVDLNQADTRSGDNIVTLFDTSRTDALAMITRRLNYRVQQDLHLTSLPDLVCRDEAVKYMPDAIGPNSFSKLFSEISLFRAAAATLISIIELRRPYPRQILFKKAAVEY